MNVESIQTKTNVSDAGATMHRKRRHMYQWHYEWCGEFDADDRPIYLPRLTRLQMREISESAGIRFHKSKRLSVFCPGCEHHLLPDAANDCQLLDRFGIPRLTCSNIGCDEEVDTANSAMRQRVLWPLISDQSGRKDELEEELLEDIT